MRCYERDPRFDPQLARAAYHPLRLLILKISARGPDRCPSVKELRAALATTPGCEHVTAEEVNYHRNRLVDAGLLPAE